MNRSQRRQAERQARKNEKLKRQITEDVMGKVEESNQQMYEELEQRMIDQRVEAMMCCFALALHRRYGFGAKRIFNVLSDTDEIMSVWANEPDGFARLSTQVENEIDGLRIRIGDD